MATIKQIEITTVRFIFTDDEQKEPVTITEEVTREQPKPRAEIKAAPKPAKQPKAKKERRTYSRFDADQKADIIARYKAGEGPKAISESLGCSRSLITHIIRDAGAVEGRTGAHLNRKTDEPKEEPV